MFSTDRESFQKLENITLLKKGRKISQPIKEWMTSKVKWSLFEKEHQQLVQDNQRKPGEHAKDKHVTLRKAKFPLLLDSNRLHFYLIEVFYLPSSANYL